MQRLGLGQSVLTLQKLLFHQFKLLKILPKILRANRCEVRETIVLIPDSALFGRQGSTKFQEISLFI